MEFVNCGTLGLMVTDFIESQERYPDITNIWRYMSCLPFYDLNTIVVGQNPYPSGMTPYLGAAFAQTMESVTTASVNVFARHFEREHEAIHCLRHSWYLLTRGKAFVNADYFPSMLGGGSSDIDCIIRVDRTVEFLFYSIATTKILEKESAAELAVYQSVSSLSN